jgi:hypothetical protein
MSEDMSYEVISQPPEQLLRASLVSSHGDNIPIDSQNTAVFQFEKPGSADYIEVTQKASRMRILTDDPHIFEVLSEIGCRTVCEDSWDNQRDRLPRHVVAGGEWDVLDELGRYSLIREIEKRGALTIKPEEPDEPDYLKIPTETPIITYRGGDQEIQMHYFNTMVVDIEDFPEMSHVLIENRLENGDVSRLYLFGDPDCEDYLYEEGFDYRSSPYPSDEIVRAFLGWESSEFDAEAAYLLGGHDEQDDRE